MIHFFKHFKSTIKSSFIFHPNRRNLNYKSTERFSQLGHTFNQRPLPSCTVETGRAFKNKLKNSFNSISITIPFVFSNNASSSSSSSFYNSLFPSNNISAKNSEFVQKKGLFGKSELETYKGFYLLKEKIDKRVNELITEINEHQEVTNKNQRKLVEIFDDISNEICSIADLAEFVRTSHPDIKYREIANIIFLAISQKVEELNTNPSLYSKLKNSLKNTSNTTQLDECDRRVCKLFINDFEQSGIHLDQNARNKFAKINDQLVDMLTKFQINSQAPSKVNTTEVDPKFSNVIKYLGDPIYVESMFINTDDNLLREFIYKSYLQPNSVQESYFLSILSMRKEIAYLCGFKTFSHRANINMILETPENVIDFLVQSSNMIKNKAEQDFLKLRDFKKNVLLNNEPLLQWDIPVISNKLKKKLFNIEQADYMNYFSLGSCIEGLNLIVNHLYNVSLEIEKTHPGELWHHDIYKLAVKDSNKNLVGYIYCDFYQRPQKFANVDCHFTIQCSKQLKNGQYQIPIVVLHLNFPPPLNESPTLLTFEMMENLFHEFGHAMHSMFAKTRYQHVSGTRCSTDLAEVPSQLMEYYCREPRVLKLFAKHYQTHKPMDEKMIHKLCESKKLFESCELQSQIVNSMLDQAFHTLDFDKSDLKPVDVVKKITNEFHSLKYVPGTHWHLRYTHLVGYGAKYYSYLISKSIASKIWFECFEKDPLNSSSGENYRKKLLQYGGEKRPQELINSLIGFDINTKSLVNSLAKNFSIRDH